MSGNRKPRSVTNTLETAITTPSERILQECHSLYTDEENGLVKMASRLNLRLLAPRKKIIVMIMGNHSAGKSSFINWYVEEHIQKTGVAIETQGFTFVTSGRKRESLTGNATLHLYPHFRPILEFKGLMDYLSAEISTSKQKKFSLVTFVDTPGLVDGDMVYPFDVNGAITSFGEQADLIFVFFDPMGQALCKRTINIVEKLSEKCGDKLRFYLSKADEAGRETDRQRVMMQIVQELCRRPGLNKCGFEMPTIYIPDPQKPSRCVNQIGEVCETIEKSINQAVQKTLDQLEKDCDLIVSSISNKLEQDRNNVKYNKSSRLNSFLCWILAFFLPAVFITSFLINTFVPDQLGDLVGDGVAPTLYFITYIVLSLWEWIPEDGQVVAVITFGAACYLFLFLARYFARQRSKTLTKKEKKNLIECNEYVKDVVKTKKKLYKEYLKQCAAEYDFN
ncbi:EH domain-containing protein 1 isoform X2 [Silurus meridionalis]|uniref:EH domain-containing protein 1 isoform X2 n=1 Tax=Silurus meridionalis TaxID=175797 RepID=UPI001EE9B612|nr:EH domain-containing protein 1 isoform X2 [Silurus meridionalis]